MDTKICSKCGKELSLTEFHKNGFDRKGQQKYRGYCKSCANKRESARYYEKKAFAEAQKQRCAKCGDTRPYVLDFHHVDPTTKSFTIGKMKKGSTEVIQKEIDKCIVLCANCHREFHFINTKFGLNLTEYLEDTGDWCSGSTEAFEA